MVEGIAESQGARPTSVGGERGWNGRLTAIAAGDLLQTMRRETRSILRQAKGDRFDAMKLGLTRLRKDGFITQADLRRLQTLVDAVRAAAEKPIVTDEVPEKIRATYHTLVADGRSSAVAVAIASLANSLVTPTEATDADGTLTFKLARARVEGAGAVVLGAMIGAGIGGEIGGLAGAGVGAVVGGIVGGVMGECEVDAG